MINVLCFGDSNIFGTNPKGGHHSRNTHRSGRLQVPLRPEYYVVEEGMDGRTTVWDDPLEPGRRGIQVLPMALQNHRPLDLVVLLLGINDCKVHFHASPRVITEGMENSRHTVQGFDYGEGYKKPRILVISPIHIGNDMEHCPYVSSDEAASGKSTALAPLYQELAKTEGCSFLNVAPLASPNGLDQLHMDAKSHGASAEGTAKMMRGCFESQE